MTTALYLIGIYLPFLAGLRLLAAGGGPPRIGVPPATLTALVVIAVPSLIQVTVAPALLEHLERDRHAIAHGQLWRPVTALVVQDGLVAGMVGNLVGLALVGAVAERVWGSRRWLLIAVPGALAGELWGLVVQPVGGGNSVMIFALAASVAIRALLRPVDRPGRLLAAVALLADLALLVGRDIHGGAALAGGLIGLLLLRTVTGEG